MREPLETETYPIGKDGNELLSEKDCIEESQKGNIENQLVVLSYKSLKPEYRLPRNQIWYVSHGPDVIRIPNSAIRFICIIRWIETVWLYPEGKFSGWSNQRF